MAAKFRTPGYCIHRAKNLAYVRLNGEMIYLGEPGSPESHQKYDRLIAEWLSGGRSYVKPADRETISVNEVLRSLSGSRNVTHSSVRYPYQLNRCVRACFSIPRLG